MGTNEKFTARKPLCQVAPSPAPCPAPRPSLSGSEFTETSRVSDSHLPFLLRRDRPNPHALESGTCLPQGGMLWERGVALGANQSRASPSGLTSPPGIVCWMSRRCLASCHLRGEPGEGEVKQREMGDQRKVREDTGAEAKREKAQIFTPQLLYSNTSLSLVNS